LTQTATIPYSQVSQWLNGPIERNYGLELSVGSDRRHNGVGFDANVTLQRAHYDQLSPSFYALAASTAINGAQINGIPLEKRESKRHRSPTTAGFGDDARTPRRRQARPLRTKASLAAHVARAGVSHRMRVGVDVGGTFTDLVALDEESTKTVQVSQGETREARRSYWAGASRDPVPDRFALNRKSRSPAAFEG
jgi:hypothetical protein